MNKKRVIAALMAQNGVFKGDCVDLVLDYLSRLGRDIAKPRGVSLCAWEVVKALGRPRRRQEEYGDVVYTGGGALGIWLGYGLLTVTHGDHQVMARVTLHPDEHYLAWPPEARHGE